MEQIPGYKLNHKIESGGMAAVYHGVQLSLNRPVAVKILLKKLSDNSAVLERFNRESLIIARLTNPNIINVIDRGVTSGGMPFFVMEYVKGYDMKEAIASSRLKFKQKSDLIIQICKALSYAHRNGVVHRDIKPANVLIDEEGNGRVLDFGIAQFYSEEELDFDSTRPGMVMGTLAYMAPEQQKSAANATALSDLYSLGIMMYELFTGEKPSGKFKNPSDIAPEIPYQLSRVILSCLEPDPADRPASADHIQEQILKMLKGSHINSHQRERASAGITNIKEKFSLLDVIAEKAYGSVYLYENKSNNELMVIKKQDASNAGYMESKLLASLKHKNIINVLGTSKNENLFIIVMEYLHGGSLKDRLVQPFSLDEFLKIARQISEGLNFAHRNRIIHGNIRPSNILFNDSDNIKITDFGLSEHYTNSKGKVNWYNVRGVRKSKNQDIFATGVVFYQMLTGVLPKWKNNNFEPSRQFKALPAKLQKLISKMMTRNKGEQYQNFGEILTRIKIFMDSGVDKTLILELPSEPIGQLEESKQKIESKSGTRRFRFIRIMILLILLFISILTYLIYTGNLMNSFSVIINFLNLISEFWDKTFQSQGTV